MARLAVKRIGYFGKMPKAGDFVSRNLDAAVKEGFDRWLQESMSASRAQMKDSWLSAFLTAPIWRFLLSRQFGDSKNVLGVMIPSVDKVGRYFPLTALIELADLEFDQNGIAACDALLHEFEDLLLGALSEEIDPDYFDYQIGLAGRKYIDRSVQPPGIRAQDGLQGLEAMTPKLEMLRSSGGSMWWTEGSDGRQPDILLYPGMPGSAAFASLLRDPDHFRDLEWAWDQARDLHVSQQDNAAVSLADSCSAAAFHFISHRGTNLGQPNTGAAVFERERQALLISDGRFGTGHFAMASRVLGKVIPASFSPPKGGYGTHLVSEDEGRELDRIAHFFAAKFVGVQQSALSAPLSFACLFLSDPLAAELLVAGDYLCIHKGRHGITQILGARCLGDDATIRLDQAGHYKRLTLKLEPGDRVLLSNSALDTPYLKDDIHDAFAAHSIDQAAKALWQNAAIKAVPGNTVLAAIELSQPRQNVSELQPDLGIE